MHIFEREVTWIEKECPRTASTPCLLAGDEDDYERAIKNHRLVALTWDKRWKQTLASVSFWPGASVPRARRQRPLGKRASAAKDSCRAQLRNHSRGHYQSSKQPEYRGASDRS